MIVFVVVVAGKKTPDILFAGFKDYCDAQKQTQQPTTNAAIHSYWHATIAI